MSPRRALDPGPTKALALGLPEFQPLRPFVSGHAQTLAARFWPRLPDREPFRLHELALPDGDRLVLVEDRPPPGWREGGRITTLLHGLSGCHRSTYMIRLARKLVDAGSRVIRVNLRGCGPGVGLARNPYHSGRSEDARAVLGWLGRRYPGSPVTLIGFSLGGNIALKMAGEDGNQPTGLLDSLIAVSPPVDLEACATRIARRENRLFESHFLGCLKRDVLRAEPGFRFPEGMNLIGFDEVYTAPRCGFLNARDYYARASSGPWIPNISIPTLILSSRDDPVVETEALTRLPSHPRLDLIVTERGGHVGFLGRESFRGIGVRWMDRLILRWMESRFSVRRVAWPPLEEGSRAERSPAPFRFGAAERP